MDASDLRIVETFPCAQCGASCEVARPGDLLVAACPVEGKRYVLTVLAPSEVSVEGDDPLLGQTLGPCRLVARAGCEGGVPLYQGLDVALNLPRAVLVLHGERAKDRAALQAFVRAGKLAAAVRRASLANVTFLGRFGEGVFAVAAALDGQPFDQALGAAGRLGHRDAQRVGHRLAEALAALHARGIVHRNVGPKSVYLLPDGELLLRNFAFAVGPESPPAPGEIVGQPGYLAPEQITGGRPSLAMGAVDGRADLYSLGALLYHALVGRPAFSGATPADVLRSQLAGPARAREALLASAPPDLADLVLKLLAVAPEERPADAAAVLAALAERKEAAAPASAAAAPVLGLDESELLLLEPQPPGGKKPAATRPPTAKAKPLRPKEREGDRLGAARKEQPAGEEERPRRLRNLEFGPRPTPEAPEARPAPAAPKAKPAPAPSSPAPAVELPGPGLDELLLESDREPKPTHDHVEAPPIDAEAGAAAAWWKKRMKLLALGVAALVAVAAAALMLAGGSSGPKADGAKPPTPTGSEADAKADYGRLLAFAEKNAGNPAAVAGECDAFLGKHGSSSLVAKVRERRDRARGEADAKAELDKLRALEKKSATRPDDILRQCDVFLSAHGKSPLAAEAQTIRGRALREQEAATPLNAVRAALADTRKPFAERLAQADDFLKKHPGTHAAKQIEQAREQLIGQREAAAKRAVEEAMKKAEAFEKAEALGDAIKALEGLFPECEGTEAAKPAAQRLTDLRQALLARFKEIEAKAEELLGSGAFEEAAAQYEAPVRRWHDHALAKKAEQEVVELLNRRRKIVDPYGVFLKEFDRLAAGFEFEQILDAAKDAAAKADDPALRALLQGKAADAQAMLRVLQRAIAGAKAAVAQAAQGDGKILLQRKMGKFKMTVSGIAREGLDVDMQGFKGRLPWFDLPVAQLAAFAHGAPGGLAADDHAGLCLLAVHAAQMKTAREELEKAIELKPEALDALIASLRRHAQGFCYIPGGLFKAGPKFDDKLFEALLLGRGEVTNGDYAIYLRATQAAPPPDWKDGKYPTGRDDHPVVNVTWKEADAYARWLGTRLPNDLEWERAVRGTEGQLYPWGDKPEPGRANLARKGVTPYLAPGNRPYSRRDDPLGFSHLFGNAREWTAVRDPKGGWMPGPVVGGSAMDPEAADLACRRVAVQPDAHDAFTGFRLAWPR